MSRIRYIERRIVFIRLKKSILLFLAFFVSPFSLVYADSIPAYVVRVVDGDTITVRLQNKYIEKVRLLGIDSPELRDPKTSVAQCFAQQAAGELSKKIMRKDIILESDSLSKNRDVYGRLLRFVRVPSAKNTVNEELVADGLAKVYRRSPTSRSASFDSAEKKAKKEKKGLWKFCT